MFFLGIVTVISGTWIMFFSKQFSLFIAARTFTGFGLGKNNFVVAALFCTGRGKIVKLIANYLFPYRL